MAKNKDKKQGESGQQTAVAETRNNPQTGLSRHTGAPGLFNPFSLMRRLGEDMEQFFDEFGFGRLAPRRFDRMARSEEHTSELQSPCNLVCRLLLEKKKTPGQRLSDSPHI